MITPMEIQTKKFDKAVMGYNKEDVDDFISFILEDYEHLYKQAIEMEEKISGMKEQLETYRNMEETMKNSLLIAQTTAENVQKNAQDKADNILKEANDEARRIVETAKKDVEKTTQELAMLQHNMDIYKCQAISMLNAQIENLKKFETGNQE
jgi:cell division initiation protein